MGSHFCDAMYEGLSKTVILVRQRGSENLQICVTSLMDVSYMEPKSPKVEMA